MTIFEFELLLRYAEYPDKVLEDIKKIPKPNVLLGLDVPNDLNNITFGQLCELQKMSNDDDILFSPAKILLDLGVNTIKKANVEEVIGFGLWVIAEVGRINELFSSIPHEYSSEEMRAGINDLNFGEFGIVDYYALRMGITDHEQVMNVPWVRIYMCMNMDAKKAVYAKRLREIYNKKNS